MAYSELIKSFEKIRGYMRQFFVYGFKSRRDFTAKSLRSYDNERRRIESWLGDCMYFRHETSGKNVFLSVDSRSVPHNPLYRAFKAKSFTDNDITLHFYILDILADGETLTAGEISDRLYNDRLSRFETAPVLDESTLRKKLKEYEDLGLLESVKLGRERAWRLTKDSVDLNSWLDAVDFFSESDTLGVVGSFILDRSEQATETFSYKHRYLFHTMDSEILLDLLTAIEEHRQINMTTFVSRKDELFDHTVLPVRIYVSTQTGRQYLLAWYFRQNRPSFFRIDGIRQIVAGPVEEDAKRLADLCLKAASKVWGVSFGRGQVLDHVELTLRVEPDEGFILERLEREKRCGQVEAVDDQTLRFTADVTDSMEMLPWIRSFIGRIVSFECSNEFVRWRFYHDLELMAAMYGGDEDAVQ